MSSVASQILPRHRFNVDQYTRMAQIGILGDGAELLNGDIIDKGAVPLPPDILQQHRFTVDDYYRMAEAGILRDDERVELLNGEIIDMTPPGPPHASVVDWLNEFFLPKVVGRAIVRVQNPLRISELNEPEPDLMLLKPRDDFYRSRHPHPNEVLLLVEVSDTSLLKDQHEKLPLYARAGIREVWIVDLNDRAVTTYRQPAGDTFDDIRQYRGHDQIAPGAFPQHLLTVTDLVG